jgi:hypothetical protein
LSWPSKRRAGKGSFFWGRLKEALKKISAGLRPVRAIEAHAFLEVRSLARSSRAVWMKASGPKRDEIGLVAVNALVVGGVERAGFFGFQREIAEA